MPCDDGSQEHAAVGVLQCVLDRHLGSNFVFGGDSNAEKCGTNVNSQRVHNVCNKNNLLWLDRHLDCVVYTFNVVSLGV